MSPDQNTLMVAVSGLYCIGEANSPAKIFRCCCDRAEWRNVCPTSGATEPRFDTATRWAKGLGSRLGWCQDSSFYPNAKLPKQDNKKYVTGTFWRAPQQVDRPSGVEPRSIRYFDTYDVGYLSFLEIARCAISARCSIFQLFFPDSGYETIYVIW